MHHEPRLGHSPAPSPQPPLHGPAASWAVQGLFFVALAFAVREARPLLAPVVVAVVLTFVLAPLVRRLRRVGVPEVAGAALVVLALLASTVPLAASLARPAALWWERVPGTVAQLLAQIDRLRGAVLGVDAAAPSPDPLAERLASEGVALTGVLLGHGASLAFGAAATVILLYFFLASEHWLLTRCVEALPRRRTRALLLGGVRAAQREIGRYMATLTVISAAVGIATGLAMWMLGLPNPSLWGAVAAALCFVPYLGPLTMMLLLLLAGLGNYATPAAMLAPACAFLVIHALESNVVSPWFVGRQLALSPVSVFVAVLVWGWLWGVAGALVAVPMLITLRCVLLRTRRLRRLARLLDGDRNPPPALHTLLRRPRRGGTAPMPAKAGARAAPATGSSLPAGVATTTTPPR